MCFADIDDPLHTGLVTKSTWPFRVHSSSFATCEKSPHTCLTFLRSADQGILVHMVVSTGGIGYS
jgi:hypothetical protein